MATITAPDEGSQAPGLLDKIDEATTNKLDKANNNFVKIREKFNIPPTDTLLGSFSCAVSGPVALHGRLYVTESACCFTSKLTKNIVQANLHDVKVVEKSDLNSLTITFRDSAREKITLTSFVNRDKVYLKLEKLLKELSNVPKTPKQSPVSKEVPGQLSKSESTKIKTVQDAFRRTSKVVSPSDSSQSTKVTSSSFSPKPQAKTPGKLSVPAIFQQDMISPAMSQQDVSSMKLSEDSSAAVMPSVDDSLPAKPPKDASPSKMSSNESLDQNLVHNELLINKESSGSELQGAAKIEAVGLKWINENCVTPGGEFYPEKIECARATVEMSIKEVYNALFPDSRRDFFKRTHERIGNRDVEIGTWENDTETTAIKKRTVSYSKTSSCVSGATRTAIREIQRISILPGNKVVCASEAHDLEIPHGDAFHIESFFELHPVAENITEIIASYSPNFLKSTILRPTIESSTRAETIPAHTIWVEEATNEVQAFFNERETKSNMLTKNSQIQFEPEEAEEEANEEKEILIRNIEPAELDEGLSWASNDDVFDDHYGALYNNREETARMTVDASVKMMLNCVILDQNFIKRHHDSRSNRIVEVSEWYRGGPEDKGMRVRTIQYMKPLGYKVGPKETTVKERQHLSFTKDGGFIFELEMHNLDIPFGDNFRVEHTIEVKPVVDESESKCEIAAYVVLRFLKSTMVQEKIKAGVKIETKANHEKLLSMAKEECENFKKSRLLELVTVEKKKAREATRKANKKKKMSVDPEAGITWTEEKDVFDTTFGTKFESKIEYYKGTINASVKVCLNVLFLDNDINFIQKYSESHGRIAVSVDPWKRGNREDKYMRVRTVNSVKPLGYKIGPKETRVKDIQHMSFTCDGGFIVESEAHNLDVPFGDNFRVETTWEFKKISDDQTAVTVYAVVNFITKTIMQSMIESGVKTEMQISSKAWFEMAKAQVEGFKATKLVSNLSEENENERKAHIQKRNAPLYSARKPRDVFNQFEAPPKPRKLDVPVIEEISLIETIIALVLLLFLTVVLIMLVVAVSRIGTLRSDIAHLERIAVQLTTMD